MELRDYQKECISKIISKSNQGVSKQVIVLATGLGKTVVFSHLPPLVKKLGKKTLILAHREELLDQAKNKLKAIDPTLKVGVEQADRMAEVDDDVVVASVPTLGREGSKRIERFNPQEFGLVIIDECHHATSKSYRNILDYFGVLKGGKTPLGGRLLLGVTATPNRSDHEGLDAIFDEITFSYSLRKGIENGYLSDISAYSIATKTDISKVSTRMGDFADKELAEVIDNDERNKLIIDSYLEIAPDSKALCFAIDVEHAHNLLDYFVSAGISSACVVGTTEKEIRGQVLEDFKEGKIKVLINVGVFTEGFDEPSIETILMARPTKSSVLFAQMIGRGTRLHPGKKALTLIDFADNTGKNNVIGLPSLFGLPNLKGGKGKKITETVAKAEKILEVNPDHDLTQIADWSDDNIDKIVKRVDIFQQAQLPTAVKQHSQFSWELYFSGFRLQFPIGEYQDGSKFKEQLVIEENMLGHKAIRHEVMVESVPSYLNNYKKWVKNAETDLNEAIDIEQAFKLADAWVNENKPEFVRLFSQDSKWRKEVPSEKQLKMLQKFKIPIVPGLTKGQCTILISKAINEKSSKF